MSRTQLLGAASAVALSVVSTASFAQTVPTTIQGGGSTLAAADYDNEFATFNASGPSATFHNSDTDNANNDTLYWPSGSGGGQSAFLTNNLSVDCNKVNTSCTVGAAGGANTTHYGASDATLSTTQISSWATSTVGETAAGHLIQLPSMGVGISIPVVNAGITQEGASASHKAIVGGILLTDNDLCGIFSGKITDWSQTSAAGSAKPPVPGQITVVYRNDGSGTSFLLLNHFAAVCTASNSNFPATIVPNTTFLTVFPNSTPPNVTGTTTTNFVGEKGSGGVASYMDNVTSTGPIDCKTSTCVTSAIGYLSPDYTDLYYATTNAVLADNTTKSTLKVAALMNGTLPYVPYVKDITAALNRVTKTYPGSPTSAPTNASAGSMPQNYVPLPQTVSAGYPIVGYTTFDFAQCYQNKNVQASIISYLTDHYTAGNAYATSIANNGFVSVAATAAKVFSPVITGAILSNTKKWNDDIGDAAACAGLVGR